MRAACVSLVVFVVACGGSRTSLAPALTPSGPRLGEPASIDPGVRGAAYLTAVAAHVQPAWGQFLEDCRLRLPRTHALNDPSLFAIAELAIGADGRIAEVRVSRASGIGEFDTVVFDVLGDVSPLPAPPGELASDDELVHLRWLFARDRRQAGPATAQLVHVQLPLLGVVDHLIQRGALVRAAARVSSASPTDPDRSAATERVMLAVLAEGLASPNGDVRRATVEAIGRAGVQPLAHAVHRFVSPMTDGDLRVTAIAASAALGNASVVPALLLDYRGDLASRPQIALAKTAALVALGRASQATAVIRAELEQAKAATGVPVSALAALALAPDPALAPRLAGWFRRGDARTRAAVCTALPAAAPIDAGAIIIKGLRDADATVRAMCVDAAARQGKPMPRLRELARDRDEAVRAHAISALAAVDPTFRRPRVAEDPAPAVRVAATVLASEAELRALAADRDPDVRAAAITRLGDRAPDVVARAASDPAPQVRKAAIAVLHDDDVLAHLANDDSPDVASAAEVRFAQRRGRAAVTTAFLDRIVATPANSTERVRIALAWLLAR